ncbi:Nucleoporin nup85 [Coemansia sp. RSA 2607]|nr:Nucleoporin nup85 [Coemansia sp. RSA 2607]
MVIKLITADGAVIKVEREVIEQSGTVRNILNDVRMTDKPIPLPNVSGPILTKIIQYCEHHKDDASRRQAKPSNHDLESDCSEAAVQKAIAKIDDFDRDFCLVDQGTLFDLISAANFLDIQPLVDLVGYTVASMMKGKSVEEIRKTFGIKSDFSTKEEERVRKDNAVRWKQWNQEMKDTAKSIAGVLQDGSSNSEDSALQALKTISEIMSGNVDAISTESEYWQDILGAVMLYSEPTAQVDRLPSLIGAIMEQYESSDLTDLDRVLIALLSHDLPTFLILCSHIDPWLSAHTADLMHHLGILDTCRRVFPLDPREHYLVALGESYVGHEDLWRVGLDYLGLVGTRSAHGVLEECAVRLPLESDRKAEQVLRVCDTFGLNRARDRIHRQLGRMKWRQGRLGAAIGHFAQVADMASIEVICDQLWKEYLESGKLTYGSVIDSVISTGVQHERLQFLTKYRDFYESYKNAEYVEAGRIMMSILLQEIAPQSAVADLLVDTIPLLESDVLVFSSDDTFELMRCAEALASAEGSDAPSELTIFNAACSRNLARAFVMS